MLVMNSYVLHRKFGDKRKLSQYDLRMKIVHDLLEEAETAPLPGKRGRVSHTDPPRRLRERHFPSFLPAPPGSQRKHASRVCHACNGPDNIGRKRKESCYQCAECNVTLCVPDCFKAFHTVLNYKAAVQVAQN
jgi:hypothetical protein